VQPMEKYEIVKAVIDYEIAITSDQEIRTNPKYHAALIQKLNKLIEEIIEEYDGEFIIGSSMGNATHNIEMSIEVKVVES